MSAISLKSITGITSITTPAGVDDQLTLHTNDTTQRVKVTKSGMEVVGVATFQDIDVDGHTELDNVNIAGIVTVSSDGINAGILDLKTGNNLRLRFSSGGTAQFRGDVDPIANFDRGSANSTNVKWGYLGSDRGIISSISNEFRLTASGSIPMTFYNGGSESLRIHSGGQVTVGTPTSNTSDRFTIVDPGNAFMSLRSDAEADGNSQIIDFAVGTANRSSSNLVSTITASIPTGAAASGTLKGYLAFSTNSGDSLSERLRITSGGDVTIGNSSVAFPSGGGLQVYNASAPRIKLTNSTTGVASGDGFQIYVSGSGAYLDQKENAEMRFYTNATERLRIDSSGRVIIGHTATDDRDGFNSALQVTGTGGDDTSITVGRWIAGSQPPHLVFSKSRNGTIGSHTAVQTGDELGAIQFLGDDGTRYLQGAHIKAVASTPIADYDMATDLVFGTNYGTTSPTERLRIDKSGRMLAYGTLGAGNLPLSGNAANAAIQIRCQSKYQGIAFGEGASHATIGRGANNAALVFTANANPANLGGGAKTTFEWWSGNAGGGGPGKIMGMEADGRLTLGDGNELASSYVTNLLVDAGDWSKMTLVGTTSGGSSIAFSDGSGSAGSRMAGFIQMNHTSTDEGPRLMMGLEDTSMIHLRSPANNRGQLEIYGNFNESDKAAIEINDGNDARKVYITNSSGDFNALTRNGSQTKGQLKMFESGVLIHNMKNPDATSTLQTLRTATYKVTSGSTYTSVSPIQSYMQKGDPNNYGCFEEANCTLEVNGGGNDHYQPVGFVPRGYNLDTTSFGGQWAGEMWIHQTSSQNPESYGYSGYNNWATMSFKCRWDCAHWNAKPNGFWVEHYINQGRGNIGKIDASTTMSQFVIYLLPGSYKIRWNAVRGMSVHRPVSDGAALVMRDGGSFVTYSTLAFSSRNTSFDNEIAPGSASFAHCT